MLDNLLEHDEYRTWKLTILEHPLPFLHPSTPLQKSSSNPTSSSKVRVVASSFVGWQNSKRFEPRKADTSKSRGKEGTEPHLFCRCNGNSKGRYVRPERAWRHSCSNENNLVLLDFCNFGRSHRPGPQQLRIVSSADAGEQRCFKIRA